MATTTANIRALRPWSNGAMTFSKLENLLGSRLHRNFGCNTTIERESDSTIIVRYHGNTIARYWQDGLVYLTNAGWYTSTTKERLNSLGASIYQKNWVWYEASGEGEPWTPGFYRISPSTGVLNRVQEVR